MYLPVSSKDIVHFYQYLCAHILITSKQFLLLINVPIQDHTQQLALYEVFTWDIPHGNFSACYNINTKYIGITQDKIMAVELTEHQFYICRDANGKFCHINTPLQPLTKPPSCITAIYAKNTASINMSCSLQIKNTSSISIPMSIAPNVWILTSAPSAATTGITVICPEVGTRSITPQKPIYILCLPPTCSTSSPHFHLPPHCEIWALTINISLETANLNIINMSSLDFHIWQHLEDHWNETQLHHLAKILSVPTAQLYKHIFSDNKPITPFTSSNESINDTTFIWTLFLHTGVYVTAIGSLIPAGLRIFCCNFFWCWPTRLPLQPDSMQYTIVDDDVEPAPIYRCNGKARPCENHDLHIEWEPTWTESQQKQQTQAKGVPASWLLDTTSNIWGTW